MVAGFDGSPASRNALAYAAGMARRLERPLLVVYVTARGIYCEPLTGQVIRTANDHEQISRWLLAELDQVCDAGDLQVHTTTRCGTPARDSPPRPRSTAPTRWSSARPARPGIK